MDQLEEPMEYQTSFARGRKWSATFHVLLSTLAMLAVVVMLNYLAHRHDEHFYLSRSSRQTLSPLSLRVLGELTNQVKMIVFFDRSEPLYGAVSALAKEYQARSRMVDLEFADARMPGRAQAIRNQYRVEAQGDTSRVIFDSGGRVRSVLGSELSEYAIAPNKEIRRTGFRGEQLFTSAILNVTRNEPVTAYFSQGHGEQGLGTESQGYSRLALLLKNNNVTVKSAAPLIGTNQIPKDCGLLIIAGPTTSFTTEELVRIDQYLAGGGRLLALMDNRGARVTSVGLEALLLRWNVQVGFDLVRDPAQTQASEPDIILTSHFGSHPIVRSLLLSTVGLIVPRSVAPRPVPQGADAAKVTELILTSSDGYNLVAGEGKVGVVQHRGVVPLAVAGERGGIQGVKTEKGAARYVVVGDALFLSNSLIGYAANADFATSAVQWLLSRDSLLNEIGPRPVSEYQIVLTEQQMGKVRTLFLGIIPGSVIAFGFLVWLRRRV